jgi:hypothetical protein
LKIVQLSVTATTFKAFFATKTLVVTSCWVHTRAAHSSRLNLSAAAEISNCESLFSPYCVFAKVQIPISSGWPACLGILFLCPERAKGASETSDSNASDMRGSITRPRILEAISPVTHRLGAHRRPSRSLNFLPHFVACVHAHVCAIVLGTQND